MNAANSPAPNPGQCRCGYSYRYVRCVQIDDNTWSHPSLFTEDIDGHAAAGDPLAECFGTAVDEATETIRCPTCNSPAPHLHPAVQFEGEVQPCHDEYHLRAAAENTPERIAEAQSWRPREL